MESQLAHRNVRNANVPYVTNIGPTSTEPCFISGSHDLLTSIAGYAERRPGFSDYVEGTAASTFNSLQRLFTWDRFGGPFIRMACDINSSGQSVVYKQVIGVDQFFQSVFTDTTSSTPFDFITSNNTAYFSNGHVSKKWDPVNGLSNWGISIGSQGGGTGPNLPGSGINGGGGGGIPWNNPGNITATDFQYSTVTTTGSASQYLVTAGYGFSIPSTNAITGVQVDVAGHCNSNKGTLFLQLLKNGSAVGTGRAGTINKTTDAFTSFGGFSDLWGSSWSANDINSANFGVRISATGTVTAYSLDYCRITIYSLGGPGVTFTGTGLTATTGYQYVVCYGNSKTGHCSSPSPPSAVVKPSNQSLQIAVTASSDTQVDQIRIFRSTDSVAAGNTAQNYFEIPASPVSNSSQNVVDSAADSALSATQIAPFPGFNDPPTPIQGIVYFAGRIWGFTNNQVWFSDLEECTIGVPEESFTSGVAGNYWNFDEPVQGLAVAGSLDSQTLAIFCGGRIYAITGNSLDTFRRFTVSTRRGCRNLECISSMGGMVAWLDSSNQVWASDGSSLQELSVPIRPDIVNLVPANCSLTFHTQGRFHWLVLSTGTNLYVYDMDTEQWMPPWSFSCNYLWSGEISPGNYKLMAATNTAALQLSTSAHNDNGNYYTPTAFTNMMAMVPDFGTRFSYMAMGIYDQPTRTGLPIYFQVDTNNASLGDVLYQVDDDPFNSNTHFTSIAKNKQDVTVLNRTNGSYLVQNLYPINNPTGRWASFQFKGSAGEDNLRIYGWNMAYKEAGGR